MKWGLGLETNDDPGYQELLILKEDLETVQKKEKFNISKLVFYYLKRYFKALNKWT